MSSDPLRPEAPAPREAPVPSGLPTTCDETRKPESLSSPPLTRVEIPGYEVLAELGRGGMGVVYRARQIKADRVVALKMILADRQAGLHERIRFQIEAEAVARLQHPNIVQ